MLRWSVVCSSFEVFVSVILYLSLFLAHHILILQEFLSQYFPQCILQQLKISAWWLWKGIVHDCKCNPHLFLRLYRQKDQTYKRWNNRRNGKRQEIAKYQISSPESNLSSCCQYRLPANSVCTQCCELQGRQPRV